MRIGRFFLQYLAFILATAIAVLLMRSQPVLALAVCVPLLALPGTLTLASIAAAYQAHGLKIFAERSWIRGLFSGAGWRLIVSAFLSLFAVTLALPALLNVDEIALGSALLVGLLYVLLHLGFARVGRHMHGAFGVLHPIKWAAWWAAGLGWLATCALAWLVPIPEFLPDMPVPNSTLVREIDGLSRLTERLGADLIAMHPVWREIVFILTSGGLSGLAASFAASAAMPLRDWRRALAPASAETEVPAVNLLTLAVTVAVVVLGVGFIWLPAVGKWDASLAAQKKSELHASLVEEIGGKYYVPGTIDSLIERQRTRLGDREAELTSELAGAIVQASVLMEENVDIFLDDYYSLTGEYARLGSMLIGEAEEHMQEKLGAALRSGNPMQEVDAIHARLGTFEGMAENDAMADARFLKEREVVQTEGEELIPVKSCPAAPCFDITADLQRMNEETRTRLAASGGGALATGAVTALVVKKVAAKGAFKLAAKALAKVAGKKAFGTVIGGVVGGALGSFVPGLGTAVGAATGAAVVAAVTGVALDAAMIELEEAYERDAFRAEIVSEIHLWRDNLLAQLGASADTSAD